MLRAVLLILSGVFLAALLWSYYGHFRQTGPRSWRLRIMGFSFLCAGIAQIAVLIDARRVAAGAVGAVPLYGLALGLWGWAAQASGRNRLSLAFSPGDRPREVLSGGPYRLVRHPFYSSYLLYWLAGFVATAHWAVAVTGLCAGVLCIAAALREERRLLASHLGAVYRAYQQRSGMFIPKLKFFL